LVVHPHAAGARQLTVAVRRAVRHFAPPMNLVTTTEELTAICARMARQPFVTVDTEFLRESTYYPLLCVAQIASPEEVAVIDARALDIDLKPLFGLLTDTSVLKVF